MRTSQIPHRKMTRLIQITDCHLFSQKDKTLLGINTYESFCAVVAQIDSMQVNSDYVLLTGDLSQDQSIDSYMHVAKEIAHWSQPSFWLPGNHDNVQNMQQALNTSHLQRKEHLLLGDHWQMIILDSQVVGKPHGYLSQAQFSLMESILTQHAKRFTLIALHHHPVLSGSQWLDQHCLHNKEAFWQKLSQFPQIKGILCGHIHQNLDIEYQSCRLMASPSTCIQFLPNSAEFALDSSAPGWREIRLYENGLIETEVHRIAPNRFVADHSSSGY